MFTRYVVGLGGDPSRYPGWGLPTSLRLSPLWDSTKLYGLIWQLINY